MRRNQYEAQQGLHDLCVQKVAKYVKDFEALLRAEDHMMERFERVRPSLKGFNKDRQLERRACRINSSEANSAFFRYCKERNVVLLHHGKTWLKKFSAEILRNLPLTEFMKQALELADPTLFGAAPPSASIADQPGEGATTAHG